MKDKNITYYVDRDGDIWKHEHNDGSWYIYGQSNGEWFWFDTTHSDVSRYIEGNNDLPKAREVAYEDVFLEFI